VNYFTHINKNKRQTTLIITLFILFSTPLIWFIVTYFYPESSYSLFITAFLFSLTTSFFSYFFSHKIVLAISRAKIIKRHQNPDLFSLVESLCINTGLPTPKIAIINDSAMNAFATGRNPKNAVICFTTGILNRLSRQELEGVIAHELSHVGNFDIRLMSIVTVLVGTITLAADWSTRGMFYGRKKDNESSTNSLVLLIGTIALVISPIIATLIKLAVSRKREFLADASAAAITKKPRALANALKKLGSDHEVLEAANAATAHMYIVHPLKRRKKLGFVNLFNTHPPISERIKRLESMV